MKIVLFIVPYPMGEAPSQRFRFEQYFQYLKEKEIKTKLKSFFTQKGWHILYEQGRFKKFWVVLEAYAKRCLLIFTIHKYDLIFIHREATPLGPPIIEWFIAKVFKKKIIYDFDDAIWLEDPMEVGTWKSKLKWKSKISQICKWSYKVSAGNKYLAEFASQYNSNVIINPTTIDTRRLHNPILHASSKKKPQKKLVIGWTGTHSTMTYLKDIIPIVKQLEKKYAFDFLVISNRRPEFELASLKFKQWNKQTEISDLLKIDIGLMPLTNDKWSKGKCGFKLLQYMSLEIPSIASPVGVNTQVIEHGKTGFLCKTDNDWLQQIELLIDDIKLRKKIGKAGRKKIEEVYSVDGNKGNFLSLFE